MKEKDSKKNQLQTRRLLFLSSVNIYLILMNFFYLYFFKNEKTAFLNLFRLFL